MYRSRVKYYGITSNLARNLTLHFFSEMKIFKFELTFFHSSRVSKTFSSKNK